MQTTRSFFQRIPFIRITTLFLVGILFNHYLQIDFHWMGIVITLLISILILLWHNSSFSVVKVQNIATSLCIILSGVFYPQKVIEKQLPTFDQKDYFIAEVCQKPAEKAKTFQSFLRIQGPNIQKPEKVNVYFSKENFDPTIVPGDQLIILAKPQIIKNMGNPYEFDYRTMVHNKGIYYSVFLSPGTYQKTGIKIFRIIYIAEHVRDKLMALLNRTKIENEERAVLSALTLGYRAELDPETLDCFVDTGTIHVLSVSGLHVALIFLIISFILGGLKKGKFGAIVYPAIIISFLWFYAFITGFSPSVQRSTVMFTFVIIGNILRRPINIYNSLSASALVLMLLDPNVLFDVGFQLSYLAVFGIVLLQPPIANLIQVKNKMLLWLWTMFTVSVAAQFITFPLSILYFNQFPNFFWLSNYFVIPATTFIIWLTFGFFAMSSVPIIPDLLAQLIQFTMHQMLNLLKWTSKLPHAVTEGIVFSPIQTWIIYGFCGAFVIYGFAKKKEWIFGGLILYIFLQINVLYKNYGLFNQKVVYVYNSKNTLIHLINGRTNYILSNSQNPISEQEMKMIMNVRNHLKLKLPLAIDLKKTNNLITNDLKINDKSIKFLSCQIDFLIDAGNTTYNNDKLKVRIESTDFTENIIATGNLYFNRREAVPVKYHTKVNGACFLNLNQIKPKLQAMNNYP
jgi:competence protein ComEC